MSDLGRPSKESNESKDSNVIGLALRASVREQHAGFERRVATLPIAARHGLHRLVDVLAVDSQRLGALGRDAGPLAVRDAVFLDIETTGFGGPDTLAFLVGIAKLEVDRVVVEQWLLRDEACEAEFLRRVHAAAGRGPLVTYVGKSFDRHRLDDRFVRHFGGSAEPARPFAAMPHVDLYHASKRLFSARLRDGKLATVEREILGVRRGTDLRGAECPEAWLDFVETGHERFIEPVLLHNLLDVVALVSLLARIDAVLASPADALEAAAAGGLLLAAKRQDLALPRLEAACRSGRFGVPIVGDAGRALADLRLRAGDVRGAVDLLRRVGRGPPVDRDDLTRAARLAERKLGDAELARAIRSESEGWTDT